MNVPVEGSTDRRKITVILPSPTGWRAAPAGVRRREEASLDGELVTAIAATMVSAVATGYAAMQAHIAKGAARSAEAQVALLLRQIEGEEADRFEARGPQFSIEAAHTDESDVNVPRGKLVVKQDSGPPLNSVTVSAIGSGVEGMRGGYDPDSGHSDYLREQSIDIGPMAAGGTHDVYRSCTTTTHNTQKSHSTPLRRDRGNPMRTATTAGAVIAAALLLVGCSSSTGSSGPYNPTADITLYCSDMSQLDSATRYGTLDDHTADLMHDEMSGAAERLAAHRNDAKDLPGWTRAMFTDQPAGLELAAAQIYVDAQNWCSEQDY